MFHIKKSFYACLISTLVCENGNVLAAVPPSADEVAKVTIELWKSNKILELERYVTAYIRHYPQTIAASVCGAFLDCEYRGDLSAASAKLEKIHAAILTERLSSSDDFKYTIAMELATLNSSADRFLASSGLTRADLIGKANPVEARKFYGSELPPLLKLLKLAPNAQLP